MNRFTYVYLQHRINIEWNTSFEFSPILFTVWPGIGPKILSLPNTNVLNGISERFGPNIFEQINISSTASAITGACILISKLAKTFPRGI